jgi:Tfp pilus assembly protein PilZ
MAAKPKTPAAPEPRTPERRRLRRHFKRIPARYQFDSQHGTGYVCNLSKEGMFLRADKLPKPRSQVLIVIESPGGNKVEVAARVMWTTAELPNAKDVSPGFGVRVEDGGQAFRTFFESLLLT